MIRHRRMHCDPINRVMIIWMNINDLRVNSGFELSVGHQTQFIQAKNTRIKSY